MKHLALATLAALLMTAGSGVSALASTADGSSAPAAKILVHQPVGSEIQGAESLADAPQLEAGLHQDLMPVTGEDGARYYRLPAVQEGERIVVSGQLIVDPMQQPTSRESIGFDGRLVTADGEGCSSSSNVTTSRDSFDRLALVQLDSGIKRSDGFGGCLSQGNDEVYLKLQRDGKWQADSQIPVELRVIIEPAVDATTLSGQTPENLPPVSVTLAGEATAVSGGSGFVTATELASGSISSDQVLPFEVKYYKVHVAEGQRLNYRLTVGDSRDASADRLATRTYSPLLGTNVVERDSGELSREDVGASITRSTRTSVSRDLLDAGWGRSQLRTPGYYYITVVGAAWDPRGLNPLDYELAVEVTGEASGQGAWEPEAIEQAGLQAAQASSGSWLPTGAQLGAFLGGVAVALAGFAAWWLLRRRRA